MPATFGRLGGVSKVVGRYRTARLWAVASEEEQRCLRHDGFVTCVDFSPDGRYVLTGCLDGLARVFDAGSGYEMVRLEYPQGVTSAVFSSDGRYVLTGSEDRSARLWDADTGRDVHRLDEHRSSVDAVAYAADGGSLVTCTREGTVRIFDAYATGP